MTNFNPQNEQNLHGKAIIEQAQHLTNAEEATAYLQDYANYLNTHNKDKQSTDQQHAKSVMALLIRIYPSENDTRLRKLFKIRSYKPKSASATARRQAAGQYNWALHQIMGMLGHFGPAEKIAQTTKNQELHKALGEATKAFRTSLRLLRTPDIRKAWMATQAPRKETSTTHPTQPTQPENLHGKTTVRGAPAIE